MLFAVIIYCVIVEGIAHVSPALGTDSLLKQNFINNF
jgi:hypothetical protein